MSTSTPARIWLAGGGAAPSCPKVRDDQQRIWSRGEDGRYHTDDGRHHQTAAELHARTDLVEVAR